jgi:hypothetical protein
MYSENTLARMALFTKDEKQELFYALEASLPPDEMSVAVKLKALEQKYFDLVWFARSRPENANIPGVKANKDRITAAYRECWLVRDCSELTLCRITTEKPWKIVVTKKALS